MATPSTLKDLTSQVRDLYRTARARAQQDLADAQKALNAAKLKQTADGDALAATRASIAALRAKLAATETAPDIDDLADQIAEGQVNERSQLAALLDDADAVATAQAQADVATGFLNAMAAGFAQADAAVNPAADDYDARQSLKAAATALPLDDLATAIGDYQASEEFTDAQARYDGLPQALRDAMAAGLAAEDARRNHADDALADATLLLKTELGAGGPDEIIAARRIDLAAADDALRQWATQASARYDQAVAAVAAMNAGDALLTTAESDALDDDATDGTTAAGHRKDREEKRADWLDKGYAYQKAVEAFRATNPGADAGTVAGNSTVSGKAGDLKSAKDDLDSAALAYPDAERLDYGVWTSAIPEAAWRKVVAFLEAQAALNDLTGVTDPTTLTAAVDSAESDLAAALWDQANHAVKAAWLQQEVALRATLSARAAATRQARLVAAVRGDV